MEAAGVDTAHNNVIVYAGGASQWQDRGLDGDACTTLLLTEDGFAPLDTYPAENMGDPLTLSSFMNYCFDFFPADSYSLLCLLYTSCNTQRINPNPQLEKIPYNITGPAMVNILQPMPNT